MRPVYEPVGSLGDLGAVRSVDDAREGRGACSSTSSGKRRAMTPTPATHSTPPEIDRELRPDDRGHEGRLDVAEAWPARDDERVDRGDAAAQLVGRLGLDERGAEDRREDVRGAGHGQHQRARAGTRTCSSPKATIARPQAMTDEDDRPADARHGRDPAREERPDEGADPGRGDEQPEARRTGIEDVQGEHREQRRRHAEDHRVEVDDERAEDRPPVARVAQALADRLEAGPRHHPDRGQRRDRREGHQRGDERQQVDGVGAGQPDRRDEHAADGRADDRGELEVELAEGDGRRQPLRRDHPRHGRGPGRLVDGPEAGRDERDREERPHDGRCRSRPARRGPRCRPSARSGSGSGPAGGRRRPPASRHRARRRGSG